MSNNDSSDKHTDPSQPGFVRRLGRGVARGASFPFRGVMRGHRSITDNEALWSVSQWRDLGATLRPGADQLAPEDMTEDERKWLQPEHWPVAVQVFVIRNIQAAACLFLLLMGLSLAAIFRSGLGNDLSQFARISFFIGGLFGALLCALLYLDATKDFVRLTTFNFKYRGVDLLRDPDRWWPFTRDFSFRDFIVSFFSHLEMNWNVRLKRTEQRRALTKVLQRIAITLALLVVLIGGLYLVTLTF